VFAKLQELHFAYYDHHPIGWLVARGTTDCQRLGRLFAWGLMDVVWGVMMMIALAGMMLWLNWWLALVIFVVLPPMVFLSKVFTRRILEASRAVRRINSIITAAYNEGITAVKTTKTLVREDQNLHEFQGLSADMCHHSVRRAVQSSIYYPLMMGLGATGAGLALWAGGYGLLKGVVTAGTLVLFVNASQQFFNPVHELARVITEIHGAQASAERVMSLLQTETQIKDSPQVASAIAAHAQRGPAKGLAIDGGPEQIGEIRFQNVTFWYAEGQPILEDFSLAIRPGQTVALVGPTGGGKTTVVSLLCRFYEPTAGAILLGGVDYRRRSLHWLQSNLGIVLQTPHLFSGTVRENIRYGRLDATDEDVAWAARLVNAEPFILRLEKGYDSDVGEGGGRLSTGQKQLVAVARAVLANPQVLVMDEATSSVDTETERLIQNAVESVLRERTSVVIAHRLSTIRSADRILVIDQGRIVEDGNHHELLRLRGRYYELYTNQFTQEQQDRLLGAVEVRADN
jgi:ATP-binding cassette subfamily B protein